MIPGSPSPSQAPLWSPSSRDLALTDICPWKPHGDLQLTCLKLTHMPNPNHSSLNFFSQWMPPPHTQLPKSETGYHLDPSLPVLTVHVQSLTGLDNIHLGLIDIIPYPLSRPFQAILPPLQHSSSPFFRVIPVNTHLKGFLSSLCTYSLMLQCLHFKPYLLPLFSGSFHASQQ